MGLDMYLTGQRYFHGRKKPRRDGMEISSERIDLGYWRKHPNLHGFIVETFADDVDDCREIYLNADRIREIIEAVEAAELPETDGCCFGASDGSEKTEDLRTFRQALAWLEADDPKAWRSVYYRASW